MTTLPTTNTNIPENIWSKIIIDDAVRRVVTRESHPLFVCAYLPHFVTYEMAPYHQELFAITEDITNHLAIVEAFRGSGKTTIMSLSYPIWAVLGKQQRKFVLLLAQTQQQARQYLSNIKRELEDNQLLRKDLGPFEEPDDEWRSFSLVLPKYGARITVASVDQSIRGLRSGPHRPDLIICDDLENLNTVRNRDTRNQLYDWLMGDVMPLGDINTRVIVIGTRIHEDSLISRLRHMIQEGKLTGIARAYPLLSDEGVIAWPGKYPDSASIETLKKTMDPRAFQREYLLKIVGDTDQVIDPAWIQYYPHLPLTDDQLLWTITAIDPAVTEGTRGDFSAIITANAYMIGDKAYFYILPDPINEKLSYPDLVDRTKKLVAMTHSRGGFVIAEEVGFQKSFIQDMQSSGSTIIGFKPGKMGKRTRLSLISGRIKSGHVLFPEKGAENLIAQIVHFGQERYDDLADALSMLILEGVARTSEPQPKLTYF